MPYPIYFICSIEFYSQFSAVDQPKFHFSRLHRRKKHRRYFSSIHTEHLFWYSDFQQEFGQSSGKKLKYIQQQFSAENFC